MPYFRHKEKDKCEDIYSEPETEEHIKGKRDLFEWVKCQKYVTEAVLEGWIPETHQRPDIMFKYNDEQYVIEYQCTPIASEYVKRHYLYKAAGIKDIWILGYDNYRTNRVKMIEKFSVANYSSNYKSLFEDTTISEIIDRYNNGCGKLEEYLEQQEIIKNCNQYIKAHYINIANELNKYGYNFTFVYVDKKTSYYTSKMYCDFKNKDINDLTFFIKPNSFDVCYFNGCNYVTLESVKYNTFDIEEFKKIVLMIVLRYKNNKIKTEE